MFGEKGSIFSRILIATIIPLLFIFFLLTAIISYIVQKEAEEYVTEATQTYAKEFSLRLTFQFEQMAKALTFVQKDLANIDYSEPFAMQKAEEQLSSVLSLVPGMYNIWFAFEPGTFIPDAYYIKSYIIAGEKIVEVFDIDEEDIRSATNFPWYTVPKQTGKPYFLSVDVYDYVLGEGALYTATLNYPVFHDGKFIGVVGIDVRYDRFLAFTGDVKLFSASRKILLLTDEKEVISALNSSEAVSGTAILVEKQELMTARATQETLVLYKKDPATGAKRAVCVSPVFLYQDSNPLYLYIELPADVVSEAGKNATNTLIAVCVVGFLLLALSIFIATRAIVLPIKRVTEKANKIAEGDLSVTFDSVVDFSSRNEVDLLRIALEKMLEQLSQVHQLRVAAIASDFEREKLWAATQAKDRFFASMSHEIRTPMNAIIGLSDILLTDPLTDFQRKHVRDIKVSASALLKLINDILDSAKMSSGKFELLPTHFCLPALLDGLCSITRVMAQEKQLTFEFVAHTEVPHCLYGDAERLRQVLLNLLSNGVKYTRSGFVRLEVEDEGDFLCFSIVDSGIGIAQEAFPLIFDAYSQVGGEKAKQIQGTGLGLNITRKLAEIMGGTISFDSVLGEGSSFFFRLPKVLGDAEKIASGQEEFSGDCCFIGDVLVVDDNEINLSVASGLLNMFGIECDTATSGEEAVLLVQQKKYDLVFMDHMMPDMDGIETTAAIRNLGTAYETLPIVALTANAMVDARDMLLEMGLDDYLSKPIDLDALQIILQKWLPKRCE